MYVETWEDLDQAPGISKQIEINKAMEDFGAYVQRKLYEIDKDTTQLFTWVLLMIISYLKTKENEFLHYLILYYLIKKVFKSSPKVDEMCEDIIKF